MLAFNIIRSGYQYMSSEINYAQAVILDLGFIYNYWDYQLLQLAKF